MYCTGLRDPDPSRRRIEEEARESERWGQWEEGQRERERARVGGRIDRTRARARAGGGGLSGSRIPVAKRG